MAPKLGGSGFKPKVIFGKGGYGPPTVLVTGGGEGTKPQEPAPVIEEPLGPTESAIPSKTPKESLAEGPPEKKEAPSAPTAAQLAAERVEEYLNRPGPSTQGFVAVQPEYVEQHKDSVTQIGGNYYRPIIYDDQLNGMEQWVAEREMLDKIAKGEVSFGGLGDGRAGWTENRALREALKVLEPFSKRQGDNIIYDIVEIALSDDKAVKKAASIAFPALDLKTLRQGLEAVREQNPELFRILTEKGYDAYVKAVEVQNAGVVATLSGKYQDIAKVEGNAAAIEAYRADIASLPTTTAELSTGARFLIRKTAERTGANVQEALASAPRPVVFDMEAIVANPKLKETFCNVVPAGQRILTDYEQQLAIAKKQETFQDEGTQQINALFEEGVDRHDARWMALRNAMTQATRTEDNPDPLHAFNMELAPYWSHTVRGSDEELNQSWADAFKEQWDTLASNQDKISYLFALDVYKESRAGEGIQSIQTSLAGGGKFEQYAGGLLTAPFVYIAQPFAKVTATNFDTPAYLQANIDPETEKVSESAIQYLKDRGFDAKAVDSQVEAINRITEADAWNIDGSVNNLVAPAGVSEVLTPLDLKPTGREWAEAGATIALMGLGLGGGVALAGVGLAGKLAELGVVGAGTGIFGKALADNWDKMDNIDRAVGIAMLSLPLVITGAVVGAKAVGGIASDVRIGLAEGGIHWRGAKTGGLDVYQLKLPPEFDFVEGVTEADIRAVFKLSAEKQAKAYAELLTPESQKAFWAINDSRLVFIEALNNVFNQLDKGVDFTQTPGISRKAASELQEFFQDNVGGVKVGGSQVDAAYGVPGITPKDFDVYALGKSPQAMASELAGQLKKAGVKVRLEGSKLFIGDAQVKVEFKIPERYAPLPFGWQKFMSDKPVVIDGVPFENLANQFVNRGQVVVAPGIKQFSGLMGPVEGVHEATLPKSCFDWVRVGTHEGRFKDVNYLSLESQYILDALRKSGKPNLVALADKIEPLLKTIDEYEAARIARKIEGLPVDEASKVRAAEAQQYQKALLELIDELQITSATKGTDISLNAGGIMGDYFQGQQLVNSVASSYKLKSAPVYELGLWERLAERARGAFDDKTGEISLTSVNKDMVGVALHEIVHRNQADFIASYIAKAIKELNIPGKYKGEISDAFWELASIEQTRRLSGIRDLEYRQVFIDKLNDMGREAGIPDLVNHIEDAVSGFVDANSMGSPVAISQATNTFLEYIKDKVVKKIPQTGGTVTRIISPMGKVTSGYIVHVTEDIRPWLRGVKTGENRVGWMLDENGKWVKAPADVVFTSPDVGLDRMIAKTGSVPENAGIIFIRVTESDLRNLIKGPFRFEDFGQGKVALDERFMPTDMKLGNTLPNERALSPKSVTGGQTAEYVINYPRTPTRQYPAIVLATESAKEAGLASSSFLSEAQLRVLNRMAWRATLGDFFHPHRLGVKVEWEAPAVTPTFADIFYRETLKIRGASRESFLRLVNEKAGDFAQEAMTKIKEIIRQAIKDERGGIRISEAELDTAVEERIRAMPKREFQEAVRRESEKLAAEQIKADTAGFESALRSIPTDKVAGSFIINLRDLLGQTILGSMGVSSAVKSAEFATAADLPSLPSDTGRIATAITEGLAATTPAEYETLLKTTESVVETTPKTLTMPLTKTTPVTTPTTPLTKTTPVTTPTTLITTIPPPPPPPPPPPSSSPPVKKEEYKATMEKKRREFAGAICWRQGALGRRNPKPVWYAIKAPYSRQEDVGIFIGEPPPDAQIVKGGAESAYRSIQTITGKAPEELKIDLGTHDIIIRAPTKKPGKPGAIVYKRDVKQETTGDITIGPRRPKVTKGTVEEPLVTNPPLGSSKMPAAVAAAIGSYKGKVTPEGKVVVRVRRL